MGKRVEKRNLQLAQEATNEVLDHYQKWLMDLEKEGHDRPEDLMDRYRSARRLRDYLRNLCRAKSHPEIKLNSEDSDLLASCCLFKAADLETQIADSGLRPEQEAWLDGNVESLVALAYEFAESPVEYVRGPGRTSVLANRVRKTVSAINAKVKGLRAAPSVSSGVVEDGQILKGSEFLMDQMFGAWDGERNSMPEEEFSSRALDTGPESGSGKKPSRAFVSGSTHVAGAPAEGEVHFGALAVDATMVKDPRLRAMLQVDLKGLGLALQAGKPRLASVLISSVFEALVLDVAMKNRGDLSLQGTPDTWNLQGVVTNLMGGRIAGPDRNTLFHIFSCKNLIRPSVQLNNPIVSTKDSVEKMLEFVQKFVIATGLGSGSSSD